MIIAVILALGLIFVVVVAGFLLIPRFIQGRTPSAAAPSEPVVLPPLPAASSSAAPEGAADDAAPDRETVEDAAPPADLVRAMTAYVDECFGEPGRIALSQVVVHGDEAAAIATVVGVPGIEGESALVLMRRVNGTWRSVDYGSGLEAPTWYPHW